MTLPQRPDDSKEQQRTLPASTALAGAIVAPGVAADDSSLIEGLRRILLPVLLAPQHLALIESYEHLSPEEQHIVDKLLQVLRQAPRAADQSPEDR